MLQWSAMQAYGTLSYEAGTLAQGEAVMIQGASGSGKSTLLRLLNGSLLPDSGDIIYEGKDIRLHNPLELRRSISLILQRIYLTAGSVEENFASFYSYRALAAPSQDEMRSYLDLCCYEGELDTAVTQLSGGEQQRVYLAIMLSFEPPIIFLDEPTAALDEATSHKLLQNITKWVQERAASLVFITHDSSLAAFASRVLHISPKSSL